MQQSRSNVGQRGMTRDGFARSLVPRFGKTKDVDVDRMCHVLLNDIKSIIKIQKIGVPMQENSSFCMCCM